MFEEDDSRNYEWDSDSFELDCSEQFSLYIDRLDEHSYSNSQCPEDSVLPEIKDILHETLLDFLNSPAEQEANQALEHLLEKKNLLNEWFAVQCAKMKDIYNLATSEESVEMKQKHFTEFYTLFNSYLKSASYLDSLRHLVGDLNNCGSIIKQLLTSVVFLIQRNLLQEKASAVKTDTQSICISPSQTTELPSAGKGKIRYVGGYTVAKTRYRLAVSLCNMLFTPGMDEEVKNIQNKLFILDNFTVSASEIQQLSIYEDTLEETSRKKNTSEGLVNIPDKVFEFFEVGTANSFLFIL